jgi:hypothetical protein
VKTEEGLLFKIHPLVTKFSNPVEKSASRYSLLSLLVLLGPFVVNTN